jgi:hypothetical protein
VNRFFLASCLLAACAHAPPPTVTGAQLYAQVAELQTTGAATVGNVRVFETSVLTNGADGPSYVVKQVIDHCKGGDPTADIDCTLALLVGESFGVTDHVPVRRDSLKSDNKAGGPALSAGALLGVAAGISAGLVYGLVACDFPGCKAVFGVPLALVGGATLFGIAAH